MATYIFELLDPYTRKAWLKRRLINAPDDDIERVIRAVSRFASDYSFIIYDNEYKELYKSPCKDM